MVWSDLFFLTYKSAIQLCLLTWILIKNIWEQVYSTFNIVISRLSWSFMAVLVFELGVRLIKGFPHPKALLAFPVCCAIRIVMNALLLFELNVP